MLSDQDVIERIFNHIDNGTTDVGEDSWQEPTDNYRSVERFAKEQALLQRVPLPFAPSIALTEAGDHIARPAAGVPIIVVRDREGELKAFRNACRHRGATLADGEGCTKVFTCRYHGWAYGLDGSLQHVPHESGFPDLDRSEHSLIPIHAVTEQGGLIFVCIEPPIDEGALADLPELLTPGQTIFASSDSESDFNWKLNIEATLEGYHIKPTHLDTFYPYGYDNLNVVETFGPNARVTFPFRRIEKLRSQPPEDRDISGMVTFAYNIFPNATLAVLSNHTVVTFSEPLSPTLTRYFTYRIGQASEGDPEATKRMHRDADFVSDTGGKEDAEMVHRIQEGLASGANSHFLYGRWESAIVNFHKQLTGLLERF